MRAGGQRSQPRTRTRNKHTAGSSSSSTNGGSALLANTQLHLVYTFMGINQQTMPKNTQFSTPSQDLSNLLRLDFLFFFPPLSFFYFLFFFFPTIDFNRTWVTRLFTIQTLVSFSLSPSPALSTSLLLLLSDFWPSFQKTGLTSSFFVCQPREEIPVHNNRRQGLIFVSIRVPAPFLVNTQMSFSLSLFFWRGDRVVGVCVSDCVDTHGRLRVSVKIGRKTK